MEKDKKSEFEDWLKASGFTVTEYAAATGLGRQGLYERSWGKKKWPKEAKALAETLEIAARKLSEATGERWTVAKLTNQRSADKNERKS